MKKIQQGIICVFVFFLIFVGSALASSFETLSIVDSLARPWSKQGIVVNDSEGDSAQRNPKVISDGQGGYLVVWEDARSGYFDIYVQKIDKEGNLRFGPDGIAVCGEPKNQLYPALVSDGAGGAIIAWQDYRDGAFDVYAQRVDASGKPMWQRGGSVVCNADQNQFAPEIVSDGLGGAIIAWYDYRNGGNEDVYAQRIDSRGKNLWTTNGVVVASGPGTQWYPKLVADGKGGAVVVWADNRSGEYDIYAQRLGLSGEELWEKGGMKICGASGNQLQPVIVDYGGLGVVLAWEDYRTSFSQVYFQFIDLEGGIFLHKDGVQVSAVNYSQKNPVLSVTNKIITAAWEDYRHGQPRIYLQKFNQQGKMLLKAEGQKISEQETSQIKPVIIPFAGEKNVVGWQGKEDEVWHIYGQLVDKDGNSLWGGGRVLVEGAEGQEMLELAANKSGDEFVSVWQANKGKSCDIFAQQMGEAGLALWGKEGLLVNASVGNVAQQNARIINDGFDNYIICWEDARSGYYDIYAQKISNKGQLLWEKGGVALTNLPFSSVNPRVIANGKGGAYVVWEDFRKSNSPNVFAQLISSDGEVLWQPNGLGLSPGGLIQEKPDITLATDGGAIVVWKDSNPKTGATDLLAQKVSMEGKIEWGEEGIVVSAAAADQDLPMLANDAEDGVIVVWTDYRNGRRNPDVYAQRISGQGKALWAMDGLPVCRAPGSQIEPWILSDGAGGAIVSWADAGGGNYDIYAQRIDAWGKTLWKLDGVALAQAAATQRRPRMIKSSDQTVIVVWEDYRFDNWDIFAQKVDAFGTSLWGKDGQAVCQWLNTQYSPNLASDGIGGAIVTWEDYRNGRNYTIFAQNIGADGKIKWEEGGVLVTHTPNGERNPQIASDEKGGAVIITWDDYRYGGRGIYAQKIITMQMKETPDT